jgi:hypothetical protein
MWPDVVRFHNAELSDFAGVLQHLTNLRKPFGYRQERRGRINIDKANYKNWLWLKVIGLLASSMQSTANNLNLRLQSSI